MFTIGCDPEIFVRKNNRAESAYGLVPGTKQEPYKTPFGAVQVDGTALEINTDPVPYTDFEAFNRNIVQTMKALKAMVPEFNLSIRSVQDYSQAQMESFPAEAKDLGCDPDYCAYTLEPNPRPDGNVNFRTGAGHIHVGWGADIPVDDPDHLKICAFIVKYFDLTVGTYSVLFEDDPRRRELYGKAGAFRPKPYGVEYRTPSNFWLRNKETRREIFELIRGTLEYSRRSYRVPFTAILERAGLGTEEEALFGAINSGNKLLCRNILRETMIRYLSNAYQPWAQKLLEKLEEIA